MIIKVDVKVAGDDEFMRCGSGKRKNNTEPSFQEKAVLYAEYLRNG